MPRGKMVTEKNQQQFINYILSQKAMMQMLKPFGKSLGRKKTLSGIPFRAFHARIFDTGRWPYNVQNDNLLMMLYSCAGEDKYIDNEICGLLDELAQTTPVRGPQVGGFTIREEEYLIRQNEYLVKVMNALQRYAPFNDKVHQLMNYVDFSIQANTEEIQKVQYYSPEVPSFEERLAKEKQIGKTAKEFKQAKAKLTSLGWDFSNNDDEEFLRTIFDYRDNQAEFGKMIFDKFMNKALNTRIYNIVDKDAMYKMVEDYVRTTMGDYQVAQNILSYITYVREQNAKQVQETAKMNAQTTDLHAIITAIGNTANKRGDIHNLKSFGESDDIFYRSHFVNEADFNMAGKVFDKIFKELITEQKKVSRKAAGMSELDFVTSAFKIMKAGATDPVDLKATVKERLIRAGLYMNEKETGVLKNELAARKAVNEKNMTALAKLYILHEMQNPRTNIYFEPYWANAQFTRKDPVAVYLDINHPKIVKIGDLEANKVQHDQAILSHYGEENGMLFEQNYNAYVMGAFRTKQMIRLRDENQIIRGISYAEIKDAMVANGWDFRQNPMDENYLIMLFNAHDPMSRNHNQIEKCLGKLMSTKVHGYYERNNLLRDIYQELREYKDDLTVDSLCDYLLEDMQETEYFELRDRVAYRCNVHLMDINKVVNGLTVLDATHVMAENGWNLDAKMSALVNMLYNAYDAAYPSAMAIADCLNAAVNMPADITIDQVIDVYTWMQNRLAPFRRTDEFVEDLDDFIFDLNREAAAMKKEESGFLTQGSVSMDQYYRKNVSKKKVTTNAHNDIDDINGMADEIYEGIQENEFIYDEPNADFFAKENAPKREILNDGRQNQYENQEMDDLIGESLAMAEAYNKYKFMKISFRAELMKAAGELQKTAKQKDKLLGEEGTGTGTYIAMATALQKCMDVMGDPNSNSKEVKEALRNLDTAADKYRKEHESIFGKRGDGKTRYDVSVSWSGSRIEEMISTYDRTLQEVQKAGRAKRINLKIDEISDKKVAFACGAALGKNSEAEIPRQKRNVLQKQYDRMRQLALGQRIAKEKLIWLSGNKLDKESFTEKNTGHMKLHDFAVNCVVKKYHERITGEGATIEDVQLAGKEIGGKAFTNEVSKLEKSKVFNRLVKKNPKHYYRIWKNVNRIGADLAYNSTEYLDGIKEMSTVYKVDGSILRQGSFMDYIQPADANVSTKNAHKKLAQVIAAQIISGNEEFARGVALDAIEREETTYDILDHLRGRIEKYLNSNKVLNGKGFNREKFNRSLENGSFMKKVVQNLEKQRPVMSRTQYAAALKTTNANAVNNRTSSM